MLPNRNIRALLLTLRWYITALNVTDTDMLTRPRLRLGHVPETVTHSESPPRLYTSSYSLSLGLQSSLNFFMHSPWHHAQHFLIESRDVSCRTLKSSPSLEVFLIQLVDFISLPGYSLRASNGDLIFQG